MLEGDASLCVNGNGRASLSAAATKTGFSRRVRRQHRQRPLSHPHSVLPPLALLPPASRRVLLPPSMELLHKLLPFKVFKVGGNFGSVNIRPDCWQQRQDGQWSTISSHFDPHFSGVGPLLGSGRRRFRPELVRAPRQRVFRSFKRVLLRFPSAQNFPQARGQDRDHQRPQRK